MEEGKDTWNTDDTSPSTGEGTPIPPKSKELLQIERKIAEDPQNPEPVFRAFCTLLELESYPQAIGYYDSLVKMSQSHHLPEAQRKKASELLLFPRDYQIEEILGQGGMGLVFKVKKEEQFYAIKTLVPDHIHTTKEKRRFEKEGRCLQKLHHDRIVKVHEVSSSPPYIVMEYLDGKNLSHYCREQGPKLTLLSRLSLALKILEGLDVCHQAQIIHRDIKPSNIMILSDDNPKLIDFGIAKAYGEEAQTTTTRSGNPGTPEYLAPELKNGTLGVKADAITDIYSLGLTLLFLLAGTTDFKKCNSLPRPLRPCLRKCLATEREKRYQSVSALIQDLNKTATKIEAFSRPIPWQRKAALVLAQFFALLVGACGDSSPTPDFYWTKLAEESSFPDGMAYSYDSKRQCGIMFGGSQWPTNDSIHNKTREWNGTKWQQVEFAGEVPAPRTHAAMAYDEVSGETILFGGWNQPGGNQSPEIYYGDCWAYRNREWKQIPILFGPQARANHTMAYHKKLGKIILFGGSNDQGIFADTWTYDVSSNTWENIEGTSPSPRIFPRMVYDDERQRIVLFGGQAGYFADAYNDLWEFSEGIWQEVLISCPPARAMHGMAYDPRAKHTVIFGGGMWLKGVSKPSLSDCWAYDGQAWRLIFTLGPKPARRRNFCMFFDELRQSIILFGRDATSNNNRADTWELKAVE